MIKITAHSGQNLLREPNNPKITPRLYVYGFGTAEIEIGCTKSKQATPHPIWGDTWQIEFFRVFQLRFELYHHRRLLPDVFIGHCLVDLDSFQFGTPVTLPLQLAFETSEVGTICVEVSMHVLQLMLTPFIDRPLALVDGGGYKVSELFMYLTYEPKIEEAAEALPVTFRIPACVPVYGMTAVFDQDTDWTMIGESGNGKCFNGPTGFTHVASLKAGIFERMQFLVELVCGDYEGKVSFNLVDIDIDRKLVKCTEEGKPKRTMTHVFQHTVEVTQGSVVVLPFLFGIDDEKMHVSKFEATAYDGSVPLFQFDDELLKRISVNNCVKRVILSRSEAISLTDLAEMSGNPMPHKLALTLGYGWTHFNNLRGKHSRNCYAMVGFDNAFKPVCHVTFGTVSYAVTAPNEELAAKRNWIISQATRIMSPKLLDELTIVVDLDKVSPDVNVLLIGAKCTNGMALSSTPVKDCPIPFSLRAGVMEYVKIVDVDTKREIGFYQASRNSFGIDATACMAALFRTGDTWKWAPINRDIPKSLPVFEYFADVWRDVATRFPQDA